MLGRKNCESVRAPGMQYQLKKSKRYRSAFTTGQLNYLEIQYQKCPYIGNASRKEVANVLNIPERAIKIWFQNRRMKEKKEAINKEYNLDRPNKFINNVEFTNDSLNNVHSSQSANDSQHSLQPAVSHINFKYHNDEIDENKPNLFKFEKFKQEATDYKTTFFDDREIANEELNIKRKKTLKAEDLAKYNYGKVYNNVNFIKYLEKNNNEGSDKPCSYVTKIGRKTEKQSHSAKKRGCQDLPEDLSARNKSSFIVPQNHTGNINFNTAYVPYCNTQNYFTQCVPAGNILWKSVNVMPVVPNSLPVAAPESLLSGLHQISTQKSICSCDCHLKTPLKFDQGKTTSQPQYVLSVPYNSYSP